MEITFLERENKNGVVSSGEKILGERKGVNFCKKTDTTFRWVLVQTVSSKHTTMDMYQSNGARNVDSKKGYDNWFL